MNIISCNTCGVVLDADKLKFPDVFDDDLNMIEGNSVWEDDIYVAVVPCPVCKAEVMRP